MLFNAKEKFRLRESTVKPYRDREPQWGPLGYVTYKRTYARTVAEPGQPERTEEWWETVRRVVEGCYTVQMNHCKSLHLPWDMDRAQESAKEMFRLMFEMKFLPPGRGLWAMGCDWLYERGSAALNNPLHPDTRILTRDQGWVPLGELEGQEVTVLTNTKLYGRDGGKGTAANPKWVTARVSHRELHPCVRITYRSREGVSYTVVASRNHRWSRRRSHKSAWETVTSEELRIGDYLPRTRPPRYYKLSMAGAQHGFFFGDGTRSNGELHVFDEAKLAVMESLFAYSDAGVRSGVGDGHRVVRQCPLAWGSLPEGGYRSDPRYVYGFLAGYFAADGHLSDDGVATLSSSCLATLSAVKDLLESVGIQASDPRLCSESSNFKEERELWSLRIATGDLSEDFFLRSDHRATYLTLGEERSNDWLRVASVEPLSEPQEVLCATVPEYEQFVIEGFCLTRNCAFVSTKNIKTEFAEPFCFLMDMSMLGVGVAFDCEGAETVRIVQPKVGKDTYVIPDSKDGWVEALRKVLTPYVGEGKLPAGFDFSEIRPAGTPIRTFGGIAPGPGPLKECLEKIRVILDKVVGRKITSTDIVDLMNIIGKCVVAGGVRRCLPEGTEVHTRRGLLPIEDVSVGDEVRTTEGWRKVVENVYQGRQPVVDIRTQLGDFRCTPQHRMKVFTGLDSFAWKRACDLVPGDRLVFHNAVEESGEETALPAWSYDRPKHSTTCKDIVVPHLDTDMAWFLGYLHGNGYVNAKEVSVSVPATRLNVVRAVEDALSRFGVKVFRTEATEEDDSVKVRVKSRQLALYLGQFKQANTAMRVPDCIKRGRGSLRAAYLGGLYDSDGTAENRPVLLATSVYPSFLREVQNLAATLGVATRLVPKTAKGRKPQWKPLYLLTVVGERFTERIEAWAERYSLKFQRNAVSRRSQNDYGYPADWVVSEGVKYGKHWDRKCRQMTERTLERATGTERTVTPVEVFSVEPVEGEEETYDLSVEGNHEFVVGPGLVSHNTAELALGLADDPEYLRLKDPETNGDKLREWRWASNNSILAKLGMDYTKVGTQTAQNGEPGYFWLENARAYGRMKDPADYRDAEVAGTNPCVPGHTRILTRNGYRAIVDLVGQAVDVWNGREWSTVEPRVTGENQPLVRVSLSDGTYLDCTPYHEWCVTGGTRHQQVRRVEARRLQKGDRLVKYEMPVVEGGEVFEHAYEHGFYCGDGQTSQSGSKGALLYGAKRELFGEEEGGVAVVTEDTPYRTWVGFPKNMPGKDYVPVDARLDDRLAWLAGLLDADGTVTRNPNSCGLQLASVNKDFLREVRLLTTTLGLQPKLLLMGEAGNRFLPDGHGGHKEYPCQTSWRLVFNATDTAKLVALGLPVRRLDLDKAAPDRDARRFVTVESVEELPGVAARVYCFTEPLNHTGVFEGVVTGQCCEQSLESYEICNLVETFPSRHDSFEEYKRTLKFAYLYAKTVTLIPTHNERTNAIMLRNRRIGLSQSGIVESFRKIGRREHLRWCDEGYAYVTELDKIYSRWLCIPASIKKTTVKPSGCRPADALTVTNRGILTLEELLEDHPLDREWADLPHYAYAYQGQDRQNRILRTYRNGVSATVRIRLSYNLELDSTPNHLWYVKSRYVNKKLKPVEAWVRADELRSGDVLDLDLNAYRSHDDSGFHGFVEVPVPDTVVGDRGTVAKFPVWLEDDLAWFLGYLWGNGAQSHGKYRLRFMDEYRDCLEKVQRILHEEFGLDADIHRASEGRNAWVLDVGCRHLWDWMEANRLMKWSGSGAMNPIPRAVRSSASSRVVAFFAGLFDADGCFSVREGAKGKMVWSTADAAFAKHAQNVAWSVGLALGRSHNTQGKNLQAQKSMWLLDLSPASDPDVVADLKHHSVGIARSEAQGPCRWKFEEPFQRRRIVGKVEKVSQGPEVETFDVEVENEHWYYAGCVKSHNTVSLLPGVTPGIHYPHSEYYLRRIRVQVQSPLWRAIQKAGYPVEESVYGDGTMVCTFPVHEKNYDRAKHEVSIWEQVENAALMQYYWSDNQVSVTVTFRPEEAKDIPYILELFEHRLKGISFLPLKDHGYAQAPYEEIDREAFEALTANLRPLDFSEVGRVEETEKFCTTDSCEIRSCRDAAEHAETPSVAANA